MDPQTQMGLSDATAARRALTFVVLLGVVSLFADMTYEGSRSIWGPYLGTLGATGAIVGLVAGGGEQLGYVLLLFTGALADRTKRYWAITIVGYAINLLAVPALALAGNWPVAAGLVILERSGKALRTPRAMRCSPTPRRTWAAPAGHSGCMRRWIRSAPCWAR